MANEMRTHPRTRSLERRIRPKAPSLERDLRRFPIEGGLFAPPAPLVAFCKYTALRVHLCSHGKAPVASDKIFTQQLCKRKDAKPVERRNSRRELSPMAGTAGHERLVEKSGPMARQDAQPEIVVFASRHVFIESAGLRQQSAP